MITQECRPVVFDEVAGQGLNVKILKAIAQNPDMAPHSLIFQGAFGTGKSTCARILARALNCKHPRADGSPCGKCENCKADINSAYFYQEYDAAVIGNIDEIRKLRDTFQYTVTDGYKVICLDEIHLASKAAQAGLLKVIEEIKGRVIFIFATTDIEMILPTIRSRSLELRFEVVPEEDVIANLRSVADRLNINVEDSILKIIAERSRGHMRNAHMLLDKYNLLGAEEFLLTVTSARDNFISYLTGLLRKDKNKVQQAVTGLMSFPLADLKSDYENFLLDLLKASMGEYKDDPKIVALANAMGQKTVKVVRACMAKWVMESFDSDVQFQTALLALFQMITGG